MNGGQSALPTRLFSPAGEPSDSPSDFFLFIKDYGWGLRYRISLMAESALNLRAPLQLDWVKLRRPIKNPKELTSKSSEELFDWDVMKPPRHKGFGYHVTQTVGSGVEAVINFLDGKGVSLLVQPDKSIEIVHRGGSKKAVLGPTGSAFSGAHAVTHCFIVCMGMPLLPIVKSISFFDLQEEVARWQA